MQPKSTIAHAQIARLAWPICCAMLGETLIGLVNTKLVATLGADALAGVGIGNAVIYICMVTVMGLMRGIKICTAHAVGAAQAHTSKRYAQLGLVAALFLGCWALWLSQSLCVALAPWLLAPSLQAPTLDYLLARSLGFPACFAVLALVEYRQGLSDVRLPMVIGLLGNLLNGVLAYALIHGHMGLPQLGVRGAGIGSSITEGVQCLVLLACYARDIFSKSAEALPSWSSACKHWLQIGLPTAMHCCFEYMAFATCTLILAGLGQSEIAAHQIVVVINRLAYLPGLAIGEVTCILVGQSLGASQMQNADATVKQTLRLAMGVMALCGVFFILCARALAGFFTQDPQISEHVIHALWVAGLFQVLDATNIVMRGALRGAQDVRITALVGICVLWTCVPSFTWLLGERYGFGMVGAWLSFLIETSLCAAFFSYRWYYGRWRVATHLEQGA